MSKVVYLLGAGASRGTRDGGSTILSGLPVVNEIVGELEYMVQMLNSMSLTDKSLELIKSKLIADFRELKKACYQNATIDTYAKKLWLQNKKDEFSKVELLLTMFFILEQIIRKPDRRYDTFFANVLERKIDAIDELTLPDDIKILSWNYDNQLEMTYRKYLEMDYARIREVLGIYDAKGDGREQTFQRPCSIIKLNGTANFLEEEDWLQYSNTDRPNENLLKNILSKYNEYREDRCDSRLRLNFAWENKYPVDVLNKFAPNMLQDATTLVVIGYSFPYFNREIDRIILGQMQRLGDIYIQDPNADQIKQYITPVIPVDKLSVINIHTLNEVSQFFLPPEL